MPSLSWPAPFFVKMSCHEEVEVQHDSSHDRVNAGRFMLLYQAHSRTNNTSECPRCRKPVRGEINKLPGRLGCAGARRAAVTGYRSGRLFTGLAVRLRAGPGERRVAGASYLWSAYVTNTSDLLWGVTAEWMKRPINKTHIKIWSHDAAIRHCYFFQSVKSAQTIFNSFWKCL